MYKGVIACAVALDCATCVGREQYQPASGSKRFEKTRTKDTT